MKHRNTSILSLMLIVLLVTTASAFADCEVTPATEAIPFTYDDHPVTDGVRAARLYSFRVGAVVSAADAQKLLDAANLGYLNPDADGNGEATIWLRTVIDDVNEILAPDDECDGVVFGPRNMYYGFMFAFNPIRGRVEVPLFSFLTDGEPYIDGPKESVEPGALIDFNTEKKLDTLRLSSTVRSADRKLHLKTSIEIPANAGFNLITANLYDLNIPVRYASSPDFTQDTLWISYYRMEYAVQPGDGSKVQIEPRMVCFNQLSKATGQDLCVRILRPEGGAIVRREEAYNRVGPDK